MPNRAFFYGFANVCHGIFIQCAHVRTVVLRFLSYSTVRGHNPLTVYHFILLEIKFAEMLNCDITEKSVIPKYTIYF